VAYVRLFQNIQNQVIGGRADRFPTLLADRSCQLGVLRFGVAVKIHTDSGEIGVREELFHGDFCRVPRFVLRNTRTHCQYLGASLVLDDVHPDVGRAAPVDEYVGEQITVRESKRCHPETVWMRVAAERLLAKRVKRRTTAPLMNADER
jgi:hypothetical protein